MARFYITKTKEGFQWTENPYIGWNHCPDRVQDRDSLLKFLTSEGRYDKPMIIFSDKNGKPAKLFEVTRNNGRIMATVDGADKLPLIRQHFLSDDEASAWFKSHEVSEKTINEAEAKTTAPERLAVYQRDALETTKDEFNKLCSEKLSNESIKAYLESQAKIENLGAEVLFLK